MSLIGRGGGVPLTVGATVCLIGRGSCVPLAVGATVFFILIIVMGVPAM